MESRLVCSLAQTRNVQVAGAGAKSPLGPTLLCAPSPRDQSPGLFWNENGNPWGIFRNFLFLSPFQVFPPKTFVTFSSNPHPRRSCKAETWPWQIFFFHKFLFLSPLTLMKGLKTMSQFLSLPSALTTTSSPKLHLKKKKKLILN